MACREPRQVRISGNKQLRGLVNRAAAAHEAVVMIGDLNTPLDSVEFADCIAALGLERVEGTFAVGGAHTTLCTFEDEHAVIDHVSGARACVSRVPGCGCTVAVWWPRWCVRW